MKHVKMTNRIVVNGTCYEAGKIYEMEDADIEAAQAVEGKDYELVTEKQVADAELDEVKQRAAEQRETELKKAMTAVLDERFPKQKAPAIVQHQGFSSERDKFESEFSFHRAFKMMLTGRPLSSWREAPVEKSTLVESTDTVGGYFVPIEQSKQVIGLLHELSVVRAAGVPVIPMAGDSLRFPKVTAGPTAYWEAEAYVAASGTTEDTTFRVGQIVLRARNLYCLKPVSNDLMADSNPAIESWLQREIALTLSEAEDSAELVGSGVGDNPAGFVQQVTTNTNATMTHATMTYDTFLDMLYRIRAQKSEATGFIMHPMTWNELRQKKTGDGHYHIFANPADKLRETLFGLPVYLSTQCISGSNYYVIVGNFANGAIIGQRQGMEIFASPHYAMNQDVITIRAKLRMDFALTRELEFHVETLT